MASASAMHNTLLMTNSVENQPWSLPTRSYISGRPTFFGSRFISSPNTTSTAKNHRKKNYTRPLTVVAAFGDVSSDGTVYLIAGAAAVALLGTAFPILFSRKDLCPECDGAGFIRKTGATLRANAARKDQAQIVCPNCNGLGKLNQIDK